MAFTLNRSQTGGKVSGLPITLPSNESDLVIEGSRLVPMATSPPGLISFLEVPLWSVVTFVFIGSNPFFVFLPGLISILSPILILPFLMVILLKKVT